MWPAAYSWLYYFGIGVHVFVAAFIGQKLRLRQHVPIMVSVCYALAMTAGAKILSELHDGRFSFHGLLQRMHDNPAGLWGGPMIYLVLAVPVAIAMTRRGNGEWRPRRKPEQGVLAATSMRRTQSRNRRANPPGSPLGKGGKKDGRVCGSVSQGLAPLATDLCPSGARMTTRGARGGEWSVGGCGWDAGDELGGWRAGLDLVAMAAPVPMAIAKLACLFSGCCYGVQCMLPWAVTFPLGNPVVPGGVPLHPTQLYDLLVLLAAAALLAWVNRPRWRGTLLLWLVASCGLGRCLTEFWRAHTANQIYWGPLTPFQWLCAAAAGVSIAALIVYARRHLGQSRQGEPS